MIKRLYEGLRKIIQREESVSGRRKSTDDPVSADQIKIVYTPRGYIEAGERLMQKKYEEKFGKK